MKIELRGRTAVVTGGSSGIGLETAKLFLEAGANVSICGRNQKRLEQAESELASKFSKNQILVTLCDVLDKKEQILLEDDSNWKEEFDLDRPLGVGPVCDSFCWRA